MARTSRPGRFVERTIAGRVTLVATLVPASPGAASDKGLSDDSDGGHAAARPSHLDNGGMVEQSKWMRKVAADPGHTAWYIERFRAMARGGSDLAGEARLVDTMVARQARILDAGCGTGRVGGALAEVGHQVVGVDVDPALIEAAEQDHPGPRWLVGDLAELDLPARGIDAPFEAIVCAGNVMTFLAPSTRREVLRRFHAHLAADGRAAIGFGAGRDYEFGEFLGDVEAAGLEPDLLLSTWDLRPLTDGSDFIVALLRHARDR